VLVSNFVLRISNLEYTERLSLTKRLKYEPRHSPRIAKVDVKRSGVTRRAKLYYLRDRVGKSVRLREKKAAGKEATTKA